MNVRMLILLLCIVAEQLVCAQSERMLTGVVVDKQTQKPLTGAVVHTAKHSYLVDDLGRIALQVNVGDEVLFTHIGYQTARLTIADSLSMQSIFSIKMVEDTLMLSEVVVRPRHINLERLSHTMPVKPKVEDVIARVNFKNATIIALTTLPSKIDAEMATKRTIESLVEQQCYEGMIKPNISFSSSSISTMVSLIKNRSLRVDNSYKNDINSQKMSLISESEIESLLK